MVSKVGSQKGILPELQGMLGRSVIRLESYKLACISHILVENYRAEVGTYFKILEGWRLFR